MNYRRAAIFLCVQCFACGPGAPSGATEVGSSSSGGDSGPTSGEGAVPTSGGDSSGGSDGGSTGGEAITCPAGQVRWTLLGSQALAVPPGVSAAVVHGGLTVMADGDLAFAGAAGEPQVPALLRVSPLGEVLGVDASAGGPPGMLLAYLAGRAADEGLVVAGYRVDGGAARPFLAGFDAGGLALAEAQLAADRRLARSLVLVDGAAVLTAQDGETGAGVVFKAEVATGAELWSRTLTGADELVMSVVKGPAGELAVGGVAGEGDEGWTRLLLWQLDAGGGLVWQREVTRAPFSALTDLELTPDGQVVALTVGPFLDHTVDLFAADLGDGSPRWESQLAVTDGAGRPYADELLVDADGLTIPIARSVPGDFTRRGVEVHRVNFIGETFELVPLPQIPPGDDNFTVMASARGACGELVVVVGEQAPWFAAFAG